MSENHDQDSPLFPFSSSPPLSYSGPIISLDGRIKSDFSWQKEIDLADRFIEKNKRVLWQLNLGIFSELTLPFSDQMQSQSFQLAINHFFHNIWKKYHAYSLGLSLYQGPINFSAQFSPFHWENELTLALQQWLIGRFPDIHTFVLESGISAATFEQLTPEELSHNNKGKLLLALFSRDIGMEFLKVITLNAPDAIPLFLLCDALNLDDDFSPVDFIRLASSDHFKNFHLCIKNAPVPLHILPNIYTWLWSDDRSYASNGIEIVDLELKHHPDCKIGVCLPSDDALLSDYNKINFLINKFLDENIIFKVMRESQLSIEWDGLDEIYLPLRGISQSGKRIIKGFEAAGGVVKIVN